MKPHRRLSFTFNVAVSLAACVLLTGGATMIIRGEAGRAEDRLRQEAETLAVVIGRFAIDPLLYRNQLALDALVDDAKHATGLVYAYVADANGTPLTSEIGSLNVGDPLVDAVVRGGDGKDLASLAREIRDRADVLEVAHAITLDGRRLGEIVVGFSRAQSRQGVRQTGRQIALVALLLVGVLILVITLMFNRLVSRPLAEAAALADAIVAGDLSRQVPIRADDEVGHLGRALNRMTAQLLETGTQLREREQHIKLLLDSMAEAMYGVDTSGVCTFCNPACVKVLGRTGERDLVGRRPHDLIHSSAAEASSRPERECVICDSHERRKSCHVIDEVFWRADGSSFPVECWSAPVTRSGELVGYLVTFLDVTDRKHLEAQLLHAQKMQAVGTLAAGVAHDFNNILTAIVGYGELVKLQLGTHPATLKVDEILKAALRAAKLTQDLLSFGRKQSLAARAVDLNQLVVQVGTLLGRLIGEDIALSVTPTRDELHVFADASQIEQALVNLATNARDAMPRGGRLTLATERVAVDEEDAMAYGYAMPGAYALISVTDTGVGMDGRTLSQIFEPFFTTKEVGKGTGLGLSIVYGIVKQHAGHITVHSEVGEGTVFRIYLPRIAAQVESDSPVEMEALSPRGSETVLLAEDDQTVRSFLTQLLKEYGYRVITAVDGADAVRLFTEHRDEIDVLLLDVVMPQMSGREAFEEIRRIAPEARVLFTSGYTADLLSVKDIVNGGLHFIQKPISPPILLRTLRTLLGGG